MKKNRLLLGLLTLFACSSLFTQTVAESLKKLDVYYFHSQRRCPTCLAIEKETRGLLDSRFKSELDTGVVQLTVVNLEKKESQPLAEKFAIWGSSLLLVNAQGQTIDLSPMAFASARKEPERFREQLEATIREQLASAGSSPKLDSRGVSTATQPQ